MRLYQNYGIHVLETLFDENQQNRIVLKRLAIELDLRQTSRAKMLRGLVNDRLRELESEGAPVTAQSQADLAAVIARLEASIELQRSLHERKLDSEAERLEDLLRQQLVRLRRDALSAPPGSQPSPPVSQPLLKVSPPLLTDPPPLLTSSKPAPTASPPLWTPQSAEAPDVTVLVERTIQLLRSRGPLFFVQLRTELLRGPGQAAREASLRLALRLDPRVTCNDRDRYSLVDQESDHPRTATGALGLEQQLIDKLRAAQTPLTIEHFRDVSRADLLKTVVGCHRLVWAFAPAVQILMLSEWRPQGYVNAARMGWDAIRGALLTGMKIDFSREEWNAILKVAEGRQDLPMLSRAKSYFGL